MKGKNVYFTNKEIISLLVVLKIWNDSADEETLSNMIDSGLYKAWQKIFDKYVEGTDIKKNRIYPDSDKFFNMLRENYYKTKD